MKIITKYDNKNIFKRCGKMSICINTDKLNSETQYNLNIILRLNKRIIRGTVYNQKRLPSVGAAIEVVQMNCKTNIKKIMGYSYTDSKGQYLFCIEVLSHMVYEIAIYSPLNK
jgi:hypothetical protein